MYEYHKDKSRYFQFTCQTTTEHIIPFIKSHRDIKANSNILEIGCGEGGVLQAFLDEGHQCVGIELSPSRAEKAKELMADAVASGRLELIAKNIYDIDYEKDIDFRFDIVILKDVIEHIHDQAKFMAHLKHFLNPGARIFFGFPPWQMPFGGHQQICKSKFLTVFPYYHMLPMGIYKAILSVGKESERTIEALEEIKETGISIERFEKIVKENNYKIGKRQHYLFNPIYEHKFGVKPRKQVGLISAIPYIRNFVTSAAYYIIEQ